MSKQGTQACIKWANRVYVYICDTKAKSNSNWQLYIEQTFIIILFVCIQIKRIYQQRSRLVKQPLWKRAAMCVGTVPGVRCFVYDDGTWCLKIVSNDLAIDYIYRVFLYFRMHIICIGIHFHTWTNFLVYSKSLTWLRQNQIRFNSNQMGAKYTRFICVCLTRRCVQWNAVLLIKLQACVYMVKFKIIEWIIDKMH